MRGRECQPVGCKSCLSRELHQAACCSMSQARAFSSGTVSAVLRGNTAKEPVARVCSVLASTERDGEKGKPQCDEVSVACLGQRKQNSVLGLVVGTQGPRPSSLGISGLREPDFGSQVDDRRS